MLNIARPNNASDFPGWTWFFPANTRPLRINADRLKVKSDGINNALLWARQVSFRFERLSLTVEQTSSIP